MIALSYVVIALMFCGLLVLYAIYLVNGLRYDVHILHFMINRAKVACGFHLVVLDGWISKDLCPSDLLCPTFGWSGVT